MDNAEESFVELKSDWFVSKIVVDNFNLSIDEVLSATSSQLLSIKTENMTKENFTAAIAESWSYLFGVTMKIEHQVYKMLKILKDFTKSKIRTTMIVNKTKIIIFLCVIAFCVLLTILMVFLIVNHFGKVIMLHFRPNVHPNPQLEVTLSDNISTNVCSPMFIGIVFTYIIVMAFFIGIYFLTSYFRGQFSNEIYRYSDCIISVHNVTQKLGLLQFKFVSDLESN